MLLHLTNIFNYVAIPELYVKTISTGVQGNFTSMKDDVKYDFGKYACV